jgi:alanine-glyoxylate transaminase/serine-glyoxylate transaminase/serine-pyruvate transaminase
MTLSNGREFLSIPGPTTVPDEVLAAMHRPAIDIYAGSLIDLTASLLKDLSRIFRTDGHSYIYAANGHGAWEAALTNVVSRGDTVLVCESGRFAVGWGEMADMLGVTVEALPGDWRRAVDPAALEARLRADTGGEIKAVMVVQIDTASGAFNDILAIRKAIDAAGHGALLMVDTIASLGCVPFEMDQWGVDVAVAGAQKGLMMAPGLSFVAAGPKAKRAHEAAGLRTLYWDWTFRDGDEHYQKYCGTAPEHMLFGLRKSLDMLLEEGLENAHTRHRVLAEAVRRFRHDHFDGRRRRPAAAQGLLPADLRRGARHRHRRARRQGVPHRAHGPRQRADDPRHARRCRSRPGGHRHPARQGRRPSRDRLARGVGAGLI